jgi:hypothetical protein
VAETVIACTTVFGCALWQGVVPVFVGVIPDLPFAACSRCSRPAYWAGVPRQETGMASSRVSRRVLSKLSPKEAAGR